MRLFLGLRYSNIRLCHWLEKIRCRGWIPSSTLAKGVAGIACNIESFGGYLRYVIYLFWLCSCDLLGFVFIKRFWLQSFIGLYYLVQNHSPLHSTVLKPLFFILFPHLSFSHFCFSFYFSMVEYLGSLAVHRLRSVWNRIYKFTTITLVDFTNLHSYPRSLFRSSIYHSCYSRFL